jgi:methyl-accepting chemotaxis protein
MENLTPIFIAVTGAAVVLQACILAAMYIAMRKSTERMEAIATEVKAKLLPAAEHAQLLLADVRPKLEVIAENMQESTTLVRAQLERLDATVNDVVDRARLQVIRGDELLTRTLDRVEQTTDMVHNTVVSPIRQFSGLMQGISVGLEFLFSGRARRNGDNESRRPVPQDEMFI